MNSELMFSTKNEVWETPADFFAKLDSEFCFDLDPCANDSNHKCADYYTVTDDGLSKSWRGKRVFCNPPYGRQKTGQWVKKAYEESLNGSKVIVMLLPARTDTKWFHDYILGKCEIRFVKGRLKFSGKDRAPFPSMVVVYGTDCHDIKQF